MCLGVTAELIRMGDDMTMASGPAFRALADDTGREFGGSTFRVEECQFLGRDGVVDWTIRSSKCALLVSGSAVCDVCDGPLKHNLWARSSYHNNGGKALKVDPNSKAALHLISSDLLRQRLATETMLLGELRARLRRELHRRGMLLRGSCFRRGHLYPPSIYSSIPSGRGYPCCLQGLGPLHLRPELRQPILFLRWDWEWRRTLEQRSCERRRELPHIVIHPRLTRPRPRPNPSRRRHLEPPAQAQLIWDVLSAPQAAGVPKNKFSDATMQRGGVNPRQRSRLQDAEVGEGCSRTCRSRLLSR